MACDSMVQQLANPPAKRPRHLISAAASWPLLGWPAHLSGAGYGSQAAAEDQQDLQKTAAYMCRHANDQTLAS